MKKIMLITGLLFCSHTIFAQLEKGMISVGLSSQLSMNKETDETDQSSNQYHTESVTKKTTFSLSPSLRYFLSSRFAIGLSVGYQGYKTTTENNSTNFLSNTGINVYSKTTSGGISIAPNATYYMPLSDNIYFFLRGRIGSTFSTGKTSGYRDESVLNNDGSIISTSRTSEYGPNKTNTIDMFVGIGPGVLFMPGKKIGLEFSLGNVWGYSYQEGKTKNSIGGGTSKTTTSAMHFLNFNTLSLGTGIYYFF